jgi:glycosyltransferase involved in cell wall biosynthesis
VKIAIVGPYFFPQNYGIEKVMYAHAKELAARGHQVSVISSRLRFPEGRLDGWPDHETREKFEIFRLPAYLRSLGKFIAYPSNSGLLIPGMAAALGRVAPDVVHAHNVGAAAWAHGAASYCRRSDKPFYYSLYHHPYRLKLDAVRKAPLRWLNRLPLNIARRIFLQTETDRRDVLDEYRIEAPDRLEVLPNGVYPAAAARQEGRQDGQVNLLFVGRVDDPRKGFDVLETAFAGLTETIRTQAVLRVVGTISEARKERLLRRLGDRVVVSGNIPEDELERAYAAADIFVMPSYYEGFGMPFIEAMRYGVAAIGTRVGGVPEVVPEDTGILVAPGDVAGLGEAIERMIRERSFAAYGARGRVWARRFEWRNLVDQLERHYRAGPDEERAE